MIRRPQPGTPVLVRYRPALRELTRHHGRIGEIVASGPGRGPRNHLVQFGSGERAVIPSGNLFYFDAEAT